MNIAICFNGVAPVLNQFGSREAMVGYQICIAHFVRTASYCETGHSPTLPCVLEPAPSRQVGNAKIFASM